MVWTTDPGGKDYSKGTKLLLFFQVENIVFDIYIYIYRDNLFRFEFEMPQNTRHVPQMPFLFLTVTIVPLFHFLTHLLCLSRWRSVCLPTSTDSCSAGSTNGLICQWMTYDAWKRRQRRSWMRWLNTVYSTFKGGGGTDYLCETHFFVALLQSFMAVYCITATMTKAIDQSYNMIDIDIWQDIFM